jgi:tripartite-type tricarboxylate transporter receptor subunit TctC
MHKPCWKQQVLVNNHPGAGGSLAERLAAAAAPDGYTLYQPVLSTFVSLRPAAPNVPIHVPQDFLPIGFVAENPMFFAVAPSLGISTLPELIARAKKAPGEITYATTGVGRLRKWRATRRPTKPVPPNTVTQLISRSIQ